MKQFYIKDLAKIINATAASDIPSDSSFSSVSTDSRTTKKGDCFFAIKGPNFDGHDYVLQAFQNSASCAVVSKDTNTKNTLIVKDTIKALGRFAAHYRKTQNFKVLAITGSVGKTTTRHIVHHVLSQKYKTAQSPKNFNNTIGMPLTLLNADPQHQIVVAELATNQPGEISYLSKIASPEIALVTSVQPAHLEGFTDLNAIANEKISIADGLTTNGTLIINADCKILLDTAKQKNLNFITFGKSDRCDIQAKNISCQPSQSSFTIDSAQINLPLPGPGNVENALAAWALCKQLNIKIEDFASALNSLPTLNMRTQIIKLGKITVINDCYNANPASMKNALKILANLKTKNQRLVFICGDMAELGKNSEQLHQQLGSDIADAKIDALITVGELAKITQQSAKINAQHKLNTKSFDDTISACNNLHKFVKDYDIVLVKASRTMKLENAVEKLKELFDKK